MKIIKLFLFIFLTCSIFSMGSCAKKRKSVFIIIDGVSADVIERGSTPAIDEFAARGDYSSAYMGGILIFMGEFLKK